MSHAEVLDFDALVRKHVRIVPTYRSFQIATWYSLSPVLMILPFFAFAISIDFTVFATNEGSTLDFQNSGTLIQYLLFGDWLIIWKTLANWTLAIPLSVFLTLSLISIQVDRLLLAALSFDVLVEDGENCHRFYE
jgi:hypothetical protein